VTEDRRVPETGAPPASPTKKFLCIHGHFYQPPRENPWIEKIEKQDSSAPFHDWNERIAAECYAPNTASRIVDDQGRIFEIVNNYSKISFNFGPTLLSWIERALPAIYERILDADRISLEERGHGNALAQAYNHLIMPLADLRDKITQVKWGIADFEHRFGRRPEGMWLPETAVDVETLAVLAQEGIRFTLLSPHQARRIRKLAGGDKKRGAQKKEETREPEGKEDWQDVSGGKIDPTRAYRVLLPSQRFIDLFFYDGPISHAIAFERLLGSGEGFMDRLNGGFSGERSWPQLLNIATDGESYGHHFPHGDMALSYVVRRIEREKEIILTNYAAYLSEFPPDHEVEVYEQSSWSCAHGVERWRADCGCRVGSAPDWNQAWRAPLREGLNALKGSLDLLFERACADYFKDPWQARNDYVEVILRREEAVDPFLARHQKKGLTEQEKIRAIKLLEVQRHALLMFTSCGWFFDEISGIEAVQVLRYAARAIDLARQLQAEVQGVLKGEGAEDLEGALLERLSQAKSNLPEFRTGAEVYQKLVKPSQVGFSRLIAHYAAGLLFSPPPVPRLFYCYDFRIGDSQRVNSGKTTLSLGRVEATSQITQETQAAAFGVIHLGGAEIHCAVRNGLDYEGYLNAKSTILDRFSTGPPDEAVRELDHQLGGRVFGLSDLLWEERQRLLQQITQRLYAPVAEVQRKLYLDQRGFMEELLKMQITPPDEFLFAVKRVLNEELASLPVEFQDETPQNRSIQVVQEAKRWGVPLRTDPLRERLESLLERKIKQIGQGEAEPLLKEAHRLLDLAGALGISLNLWESQNLFNRLRPHLKQPSALSDRLAERLMFR
jgi:alpha-amylase/alpha-mannosidase (GH57 family)